MCRILEMASARRSRTERSDVMPRQAVVALVLFAALVLSAAIGALAASGHFPHERRAPALRGGLGGTVLFGACALLALSLIVGAVAAWRILTWPAAVIASGGANFGGPPPLRALPHPFVHRGPAPLLFFRAPPPPPPPASFLLPALP